MTKIVKDILIDAPPEVIWTMMARHQQYPEVEVERGPEWDDLVIKDLRGEALTEQRKGIGARTRWFYKFYWYTFKWDDEVTEWDENRRILWKSISTWEMIDSFDLVPEEGGTRLVYEMEYSPPYGILGKIWYRLFVNRHLEKQLEYTLLQMKRNAEGLSRLRRDT